MWEPPFSIQVIWRVGLTWDHCPLCKLNSAKWTLRLASAENLSLRKVKEEYETKAIVQNQIGVLVLEGHQIHQLSATMLGSAATSCH